ncbi:ATP-binding protein [Paenibacillus cremeus]
MPETVRMIKPTLKQVAMILLDNAIKYSNPKGSIQLVLKRQHHHIQLSVSNTGPGIRRNISIKSSTASTGSIPRARARTAAMVWGSPLRSRLCNSTKGKSTQRAYPMKKRPLPCS